MDTEADDEVESDIDVRIARKDARPSEQFLRGRHARRRVPRSGLAEWDPVSRGHDALDTVLAQNIIRVPELLPIRYARMSASPWTYFRGAAAVMAADLASTPHTGVEVQLCGDAHVLNFGLWATPERNLYFDWQIGLVGTPSPAIRYFDSGDSVLLRAGGVVCSG